MTPPNRKDPVPPICSTAQLLLRNKFAALIEGRYVVADSGCWEWIGSRWQRNGYGMVRLRVGKRNRGTCAHRASWIAHRGAIPDNLQIDHLCRNRKCVNPEHLEPVTGQENIRRAMPFGLVGRPTEQTVFGPGDPRHGTVNGYKNLRCRCPECRAANTENGRRLTAQRKARPLAEYLHGTRSGYQNHGCRCTRCKEAASTATRKPASPR